MTASQERVRAHAIISGIVQGVSFRWYTVQQARSHDVGGWVRNQPDGTVEAVFEGRKEDVDRVLTWANTGPRSARVENVAVTWEEPEGIFEFDSEGW